MQIERALRPNETFIEELSSDLDRWKRGVKRYLEDQLEPYNRMPGDDLIRAWLDSYIAEDRASPNCKTPPGYVAFVFDAWGNELTLHGVVVEDQYADQWSEL